VFVVVGVLWAGPAACVSVLKSYQQQRLTCFIHSTTCSVDAGYNLEQSKQAVGSGQIRGRGPNGASQVKLGFLPESGTDFVFAGFAEQRGFVGAVILLGLYLLVLWRGLRVVTVARDLFSAIVAGIVVASVPDLRQCRHDDGDRPITGIPLPFVSVGGSR
jgi:rod shape determining protein RodA